MTKGILWLVSELNSVSASCDCRKVVVGKDVYKCSLFPAHFALLEGTLMKWFFEIFVVNSTENLPVTLGSRHTFLLLISTSRLLRNY